MSKGASYRLSTWLILVGLVIAKHRHNKDEQSRQNLLVAPAFPSSPMLSVDEVGNCYAHDRPLNGRCVRMQDCISAIRAWHEQRIHPLSCYHTTYEHFVCCPHGGYVLPHLELQHQPQRKSERACESTYFGRHRRSHHKLRRRRSADENVTAEVIEEPIKKVNVSVTKAVGGIPTTYHQYPYMCALGWKTQKDQYIYNCGCVLIAKKFVLTAAHCENIGGESPSVVLLGGVNLNDRDAEIVKIKRITTHPQYDDDVYNAYNDIAIIKLEKSTREQPACLWPIETLPQQQLTAIGYGQVKFAGPTSNTLLQVFLNVLTNRECNSLLSAEEILSNGIGRGQICAGDPSGKMDTCQGDSGGPLLIQLPKGNTIVPYIVGLTSMGEGCATGAPSIYTRISYYIDWIEGIVWKKKN